MTMQTTADLIANLHRLDVQLRVEGNRQTPVDQLRLHCTAPAGTMTAELRQQLAERKAELIAYLLTVEPQPLQQAPAGTCFPLSFAQQRLWFLAQLAPGNPFYNIPAAISLKGRLDPRALERSFQEIVRRHAALRTTFTTVNNEPVQVISANTEVKLTVIDLHTVAATDRQRISQQFATTEAQHPFNLETGPLLRVTLLQFDPTEATLLITLHHIVADGWSLGVLMKELACCYRAFVEGESPDLPALPIQYTDFADWQRQWLQGSVLETQLAYWQRQLQDLPILNLPSDRPRPATPTYQGATCPIQIPTALAQALAELSQQAGVSLFMTLLAAFQTLLYRYTSQEDLAVGIPIANRHYRQVEGLIGFFVNSLVMRTDLSGHPTFRELLQRVRQVALAAYSHQDIPFEKLVEVLEPDRDLSRNPLFQVAFALQNAPMHPLELPGLTLEPTPFAASSSRFDLEIHLWEPSHGLHQIWQSEAGLSGFVAYSVDLFNRDRIERLIEHFQTLLASIVANPDAYLTELPLLTIAEQQRLAEFGGFRAAHSGPTAPECTPQICFHHIFEAQAARTPAAIALVSGQETFTYIELNQRANRLARILKELGVRSNTLVGLCVERSAEMVIGILGILKAGAAYVPLDPGYPSERLQFMLTDTQIPLLLTQSGLVPALPPSSARLVCLDQLHDFNRLDSTQDREPASEDGEVDLDHLAYVIYTSPFKVN